MFNTIMKLIGTFLFSLVVVIAVRIGYHHARKWFIERSIKRINTRTKENHSELNQLEFVFDWITTVILSEIVQFSSDEALKACNRPDFDLNEGEYTALVLNMFDSISRKFVKQIKEFYLNEYDRLTDNSKVYTIFLNDFLPTLDETIRKTYTEQFRLLMDYRKNPIIGFDLYARPNDVVDKKTYNALCHLIVFRMSNLNVMSDKE